MSRAHDIQDEKLKWWMLGIGMEVETPKFNYFLVIFQFLIGSSWAQHDPNMGKPQIISTFPPLGLLPVVREHFAKTNSFLVLIFGLVPKWKCMKLLFVQSWWWATLKVILWWGKKAWQMLESGFKTGKSHIWRKLTQNMKEKEIKNWKRQDWGDTCVPPSHVQSGQGVRGVWQRICETLGRPVDRRDQDRGDSSQSL